MNSISQGWVLAGALAGVLAGLIGQGLTILDTLKGSGAVTGGVPAAAGSAMITDA